MVDTAVYGLVENRRGKGLQHGSLQLLAIQVPELGWGLIQHVETHTGLGDQRDKDLLLPLLIGLDPLIPEQRDGEDHRYERRRKRNKLVPDGGRPESPQQRGKDRCHEERRTDQPKRSLIDRRTHHQPATTLRHQRFSAPS
jgi:hypothetical protein